MFGMLDGSKKSSGDNYMTGKYGRVIAGKCGLAGLGLVISMGVTGCGVVEAADGYGNLTSVEAREAKNESYKASTEKAEADRESAQQRVDAFCEAFGEGAKEFDGKRVTDAVENPDGTYSISAISGRMTYSYDIKPLDVETSSGAYRLHGCAVDYDEYSPGSGYVATIEGFKINTPIYTGTYKATTLPAELLDRNGNVVATNVEYSFVDPELEQYRIDPTKNIVDQVDHMIDVEDNAKNSVGQSAADGIKDSAKAHISGKAGASYAKMKDMMHRAGAQVEDYEEVSPHPYEIEKP